MALENEHAAPVQAVTIKEIIAPLLAIIVGMFMVILDGTAMNVALPGLVKDFDSKISVVQWAVTGYALAQAAVIPLAGWLSDRFGAKRVFLFSVLMFTIGSGLCALASGIHELVTFRIIQGLGGGMVAPIAMAFVYRLSPREKVGSVMGMIGIPMLLAPALGPVLSGWLVEYASWHWIFLINLPVGIIALLVGLRTLPNLARQSVPALDVLGMILAPLAFAALVYGVSEGGTSWTSAQTLTSLIVGGILLILFVGVELRRRQPLLELRVFLSSDFSRGIIVQWVTQIALFGTMFLIPLFLQQGKGFSPFESGLSILPQAAAAAVFMPIGGRLFDRLGARPVVATGLIFVTSAAYFLSGISASDGSRALILPLALLGAGMGLSMMPLNTHIIQAAPEQIVSRVTSLTNAFQQVMMSFAVAGLSTILSGRMEVHLKDGVQPLQALASSFGDTFTVLIGIALVGLVLSFTLRRPKKKDGGAGHLKVAAVAEN
ncbi:DHA2 family efflux MFS transporter permease subunit [Sporolactobacillus shoreicorticis]|uniref:DHA2 family efflux MFS transporter permease subunit n=1 Tax=Sporolactobacillus shoreicorticis TaxID=1923877 RepID=A0ABW5S0J2_9BACL|nr:DHA2 family efflux MFS transporter permease subunit [Sporolactobacillus shoreicorticis]MCO7127249.1 DHA2 family efflux MFS transporter permease subunit [Sporolactobacillus shoreicorticis]